MVEIQDTLVSMDLFTECFSCDLHACGGACCVEGDAGAPLDIDEIPDMEEAYELLHDELFDFFCDSGHLKSFRNCEKGLVFRFQ